ncbi:MAG TPA: non-homologous end-joining DNA ligase [Actinomycetota bacterium]|nr:non-homologous end-joining DNA ligase [Actinomycetota bacterium]
MSQRDYDAKRDPRSTPEPTAEVAGDVDVATAPVGDSFVIHQHHARRLHWDLRLEMKNGDVPVLVSWAVPKNLPLESGTPHLAVHVEDHPFDYGRFEGTIPEGNYGAGEVRIFDTGSYEVLERSQGKLTFRLSGKRLRGVWHLTRSASQEEGKDEWLAFLKNDERPAPDPPPEPTPMLATAAAEPFDDDGWLFEPKWDGVRTLAVCTDRTGLLSRTGRDVTGTYPELARLHERLVALDAIVDGEIVTLVDGRPSFERLQSRMNLTSPKDAERAAAGIPVTYVAFDVLYLDGRDVTPLPIEERKALLEGMVVPSARIVVSQHVTGEGTALAEAARAMNLEGIVAKRLGCPYRPGRRVRDWLKIKQVSVADVVVGGWSQGEGSRSSTLGALLVGAYDTEGLHFLGAVGTGFSDQELRRLCPELEARATTECPFVEGPEGIRAGRFGKPLRGVRWTAPELVARVEYREVTSQNRLRAPAYKGLRSDKPPEDCRVEDLA